MDNTGIARIFNEIADLLELQEENPFRVRAYRTAARTIETLGEPVTALLKRKGVEGLCELHGIGRDLASKITEIVETGDLHVLKELSAKTPKGLVEMMRIEGIGPKRARLFYEELGITTLDKLESAARRGRLRTIRGIGETLEAKILEACGKQRVRSGRVRLAEADSQAGPLLDYLRAAPAVLVAEAAGSLRRRRETIGDIDILVVSKRLGEAASRFLGYPGVSRVLARGETKCSVVLRSGLQVDLRIVRPACYGAALHYFTGSKAHSIAVRTLGVKRGLKINEYGVFRGTTKIGGRAEEDVFRALGLPWIPPELREDRGEIDAAAEGRLPALVQLADIKGDLHMHTTYTDGVSTVAEMAAACLARGYAYAAITDHTQALRVAGGLTPEGLREQAREIEAARAKVPGLRLLHGAEVDILGDGRLDLPDDALAALDIVVASVHSRLAMTEAAMTERVLRALRNPYVTILGHPTGRLLGRREPYAIDMAQIVRTAHDLGVLLEVNAQPDRMDLSDVHIRMARDEGAMVVISTDAHRAQELTMMRYGVDQARRGYCARSDVANTRPLDEFLAIIKLRRLGVSAESQIRARAMLDDRVL